MSEDVKPLLQGAYDIHIHAGPDIPPRAQDLIGVMRDAQQAGMAGFVLKDHAGSTAGRAYTLNRLLGEGPRAFGALALNPPVGGLNPYAVEVALSHGAAVIFFPTYAARHNLLGKAFGGALATYPRPKRAPGGRGDYRGIVILDGRGALKPEVGEILDLLAAYDGILATGHLSPHESLALLKAAKARGVRRMVVTHASSEITLMSVAEQQEAVSCGAFIEHCLLGLVSGGQEALETLQSQIRQVGVKHVILSSDFGQATNGPPVPAFARYLGEMRRAGFDEDEIRQMIVENPRTLLEGRKLGLSTLC